MPSSLPPPILYSPALHAHLLPSLAQIHADCVLHDHTLATFLPHDGAMHMDKLLLYWRDQVEQIERGRREIVLQLAPGEPGEGHEWELAGYVSLSMPPSETGPFRALVEKLLVSPRHRRKGVARAVMGKLEEVAREKNRGLLILDTTIGSEAEHVYPRLGYKTIGVIPRYGISPKDGTLKDEIFYYKDLRAEPQAVGA